MLQVDDLGSWVWVCDQHLPAWVQPLLPTDRPGDSSLPGGLSQCPCCGAAIQRNFTTEEVNGTPFVIRRCHNCTRLWTLLIGIGDEEDGYRFADAVIGLAEHFENHSLRAFGMAGSVALDSMRRAAGGLGTNPDTPQLSGVELQPREEYGANNIIMIGEAPRTGVQSLGPGVARVHRQGVVLPQIGTLWRQGETSVRVLSATPRAVRVEGRNGSHQTLRVEEFFERYTQAVEHVQAEGTGTSTVLVPQLNTIWQSTLGPDLVQVLASSEGSFREITYRPISPELPDTQTLELRSFLSRFRPYHGQFEPEPNPEPEDRPTAGETWWHRVLLSPVRVVRVAEIPGGTFVQFNANNGPATSMLLNDFINNHVREAPEAPCQEGDELVDAKDRTFTVSKVDHERGLVSMVDSEGKDPLGWVSWRSISSEFTKLERRTRASVLMADDD